jgi:Pyruvate/2-oxoacid:ferredoxin oxidoreductase delta subunit/DNA-binding Lrp family transcriptional regulator
MPENAIYQQLAESVFAGESKYIPAIFETLADLKDAEILMAAAPPAALEDIADKAGLSQAETAQRIDVLFKKGLIFKSKKESGIRYYRVRQVLQMHDSTAVMLDPPQRMLDLWKKYMAKEYNAYLRQVEAALPNPVIRVIPVNVSLKPENHILAFDDVNQIVQDAQSIAVTPCSCRVIDGACGKTVDVCMQFNKAADYSIERGTGRKLSPNEAIEMLQKCEAEGLVHVGSNSRSVGHVICNCCSDCCLNWPSVRGGLGKFVVPSRFQAVVDDALCTSCETCTERCYFEAISMTGKADTAIINSEKCMGCGLCQVTCPEDAISLKEVRPEDFVPA